MQSIIQFFFWFQNIELWALLFHRSTYATCNVLSSAFTYSRSDDFGYLYMFIQLASNPMIVVLPFLNPTSFYLIPFLTAFIYDHLPSLLYLSVLSHCLDCRILCCWDCLYQSSPVQPRFPISTVLVRASLLPPRSMCRSCVAPAPAATLYIIVLSVDCVPRDHIAATSVGLTMHLCLSFVPARLAL